MVFLIRLIVIAIIIYFAYRVARYLLNPRRKIDASVSSGTYYFEDDEKNAQKNFFIAYKGAIFAGEKYNDATENASKVVSIFVWMEDPAKLKSFTKRDIQFLENEIQMKYPGAQINWKNPLEQIIAKER